MFRVRKLKTHEELYDENDDKVEYEQRLLYNNLNDEQVVENAKKLKVIRLYWCNY